MTKGNTIFESCVNGVIILPEQTAQKKKVSGKVLFALSLVPLIMVLGNSMVIPILPTMESTYKLTKLQSSLIITLFSVPAGLIIPFAGILSDRLGRKKIIIPGLLIYGLGGIIAGVSVLILKQPYWLLMTGRIIQGIGAAGTAPIAMALVSDLYQKEQRSQALGVIESSNAMGKVVSPILGSLLALITWYTLFFVFPIFTVPAALAIGKWVKEKEVGEPKPLKQYGKEIKNVFKKQGKWLTVAFFAGAVILFTLFGVLFFLSDILEKKYHIEGVIKGLFLAIPLSSLTLTALWTGHFIQKHMGIMKKFIVIGLITAGLINIPLPYITNRWVLIALLFVGGIGSGLVLPCLNMMITSAVGKEERGIITSLYGSIRFLGVAAGPPVFGKLMGQKFILFWGLTGLCLVIAFLAMAFIHRPNFVKGKKGHSRTILRPIPRIQKEPI